MNTILCRNLQNKTTLLQQVEEKKTQKLQKITQQKHCTSAGQAGMCFISIMLLHIHIWTNAGFQIEPQSQQITDHL